MPVLQNPTGSVELSVVVSDLNNPAGNDVIFAQRYTPGGDKNGAPIQITADTDSATPLSTLILANGDFVVEYQYVDQFETSPQFPFPPARLATQEIGFDGSTLETNQLGLNDGNISSVYRSAALGNGAYAYVLETFEGLGFGGFVETQTLGYVTADGAIKPALALLDTTSGGDGPFPRLFQTSAALGVLSDGRFTVSWTEAYTPADPNFPPDDPSPTGERTLRRVYTEAGQLTTKITVDFDGSKLVENFDTASGKETTSVLVEPDGSRVTTTFGIVGRTYVEQSIQTDTTGHITEQKRYYDGAGHTLAFDLINKADGTGEVHQYDTAGRETLSIAGILSGERDVLQFTYAGSSTIPSTTVQTHFGPSGVKEFVDQTKVDGSHAQTAYAAGVTLVSHEGVSDTFQGFKGGADIFVFAPGFGKDVVKGFEAGPGSVHDVLSIDASLIADYAALAGRITSVGADTLITIDAADTILLKNVAPGALTADNFHFVPHDLLLV